MHVNSMFIVFLLSLTVNAYAADDKREITPLTRTTTHQFSLPEDSSQWRDVTSAFMMPVLLPKESIVQAWEELLDLTMPKDRVIDTSAIITKPKRAQTIQTTYDKLAKMAEEEQQLSLIKGLIDLHKM